LLSDSPPERDLEWTDTGIEGIWRYVSRLWRMVTEPNAALPPAGAAIPGMLPPALAATRRATHKTIAAVTDDIEKFRFNRAVARIRELSNTLENLSGEAADAGTVLREGLETIARLLAPMMPHLAEEMWQHLGQSEMLADVPWPQADPDLVRDEQVTIAVQINGKLRATLDFQRDAAASEIEAAALALPQVARLLDGRAPRKVVIVPNRIVNVVV
jgi:leucyl-tRNA synthetase